MLRFAAALFAFAVAFCTAVASGGSLAESPPAAPAWLLISDIHFNPFDDPVLVDALARTPASGWAAVFAKGSAAPSPFFKDTNAALLDSALAAMSANVPHPPVVIVAGDFLGHNFPASFAAAEPGKTQADYDAFVDKTIAFLAGRLDAAYPHARFVITVGNNDGYCGDYQSTPHDGFLAHMAAAFEPLVDRDGAAPDFARDFSRGGYYTTSLPGNGARDGGQALVLNSVYWSAKFTNACGAGGSDPGAGELDWLAAELAEPAPGYRWLLTHIPPGIDAFSSLLANRPIAFMQPRYADRLIALASRPAARAGTFVFGHLHHAAFEIVGASLTTSLPGLVVPSISPVQGNAPAFVTATVDQRSGTVIDTATFADTLATGTWARSYTFDAAYGTSAFDTPNLLALQQRLAADPGLRATFLAHYNSESAVAAVVPASWPWYWCAQNNMTGDDYAACTAKLLRP